MYAKYGHFIFGIAEYPDAVPGYKYGCTSCSTGTPEWLLKQVRAWCKSDGTLYGMSLEEYLTSLFGPGADITKL
jgi:hypothetical protein